MSDELNAAVTGLDAFLDMVCGEYMSGWPYWETVQHGLRDQQRVLRSHGFVECDSGICGCGSWHHRYGLAERFRDLQDVLGEAGVLDSATGNQPIDGVRKLIERAHHADRLLRDCLGLMASRSIDMGKLGEPLSLGEKIESHLKDANTAQEFAG